MMHMRQLNKFCSVTISYDSILEGFFKLQSIIFAESLCKNGIGYDTSYAVCPMSQHTYFQQYIAGMDNKFFTFITYEKLSDSRESRFFAPVIETSKKLSGQFIPNEYSREFILESRDMCCLGALLMHNIIEIIAVCYLLKLDPFAQDVLDEIKAAFTKYTKNKI